MPKTNLEQLHGRIKYYLLEWKDKNMHEFIRKYGEVSLNSLTMPQLRALFTYATAKDIDYLRSKE